MIFLYLANKYKDRIDYFMKMLKQAEKKTCQRDQRLTATVMDIIDDVQENGQGPD